MFRSNRADDIITALREVDWQIASNTSPYCNEAWLTATRTTERGAQKLRAYYDNRSPWAEHVAVTVPNTETLWLTSENGFQRGQIQVPVAELIDWANRVALADPATNEFPCNIEGVTVLAPNRVMFDQAKLVWNGEAATPGAVQINGNWLHGTERHGPAYLGAWVRPGRKLSAYFGPASREVPYLLSGPALLEALALRSLGISRPLYRHDPRQSRNSPTE